MNAKNKHFRKIKFSSKPVLIIIALFCLSIISANSKLFAASGSGIGIVKITIGEERIASGRTQLIEVLIKNSTHKERTVRVQLSLVLPNHNIVSFGNKKVELPTRSETRVLFPYPIEKTRGGDYTIGAKVYSLNGKVLAKNSEKQKKYFFAVDPTRKNQKPSRPSKKKEKAEEKKIAEQKKLLEQAQQVALFDPPDLMIESIEIVNNNSILRGETAHARVVISNLGGDVALNPKYDVYWYFAPRENRKIKTFEETLKVIAPGERKILDVPVTIPEVEQKGEYFVYVVLDENKQIKELDENNNAQKSNNKIIFSDIALVFPDDDHSFAEDGLFKFQWRSRRYNQFKVQVSADKLFANFEDLFELPKGEEAEGWTPENTVKPLAGEMPAMALALMESNGMDHLFWRIKAKDSEGATTESVVRKFYISFKADSP